jgi:hypothetical protein
VAVEVEQPTVRDAVTGPRVEHWHEVLEQTTPDAPTLQVAPNPHPAQNGHPLFFSQPNRADDIWPHPGPKYVVGVAYRVGVSLGTQKCDDLIPVAAPD